VILQRQVEDIKAELQIAPLIDVVFLLLIYFMVTAALIKKEGDISFMLPANVAPSEMVDIPVEVLIEIGSDGTVQVEGMRFSRDPFFVNILPNKDAMHSRIIDVMDACAAAGVKNLSFSKAM
jgi:biopolymer transport protein ExbD